MEVDLSQARGTPSYRHSSVVPAARRMENGRVYAELGTGPSNSGNGYTALAHTAMVPDPVGVIGGWTLHVPSGTRPV
ncbi:hypothetical protein OUZ56_033624 [Daphnia magna]|uniref:Uncharacterized protein n=1 Tax=Daphnia magna TaxID=35525 RepID=A0ABQ9ZY31_9CRUS|nr:hypothetical protein OUZ56_033624 [Daphnia magna]